MFMDAMYDDAYGLKIVPNNNRPFHSVETRDSEDDGSRRKYEELMYRFAKYRVHDVFGISFIEWTNMTVEQAGYIIDTCIKIGE